MRTRHEDVNNKPFFDRAIAAAMEEVNNTSSDVRIVNYGRGVVILPDTNRKAACTEDELIKALGLIKKYNGLHLDNSQLEKTTERRLVMLRHSDNTTDWLSLTPDQQRLLDWLSRYDYFHDEVEIYDAQPTGFKEI